MMFADKIIDDFFSNGALVCALKASRLVHDVIDFFLRVNEFVVNSDLICWTNLHLGALANDAVNGDFA